MNINELEKVIGGDKKIYVFSDGKKEIDFKWVGEKYPECLLSVNMIDIDSRNINYEIERDMGIEFESM